MTAASTCWATIGSPLCSQASRAGRCAMAGGPATTLALGTSRPYRSSSARWQATARSAPATPSAATRPSTYRPRAPRSAGTAVASTSTRGVTTSPAPFPQSFESSCSDPVCSGSDCARQPVTFPGVPGPARALPARRHCRRTPPWMFRQIRAYALSGATVPPWQRVRPLGAASSVPLRQEFRPIPPDVQPDPSEPPAASFPRLARSGRLTGQARSRPARFAGTSGPTASTTVSAGPY
jgi:hypothetical protein